MTESAHDRDVRLVCDLRKYRSAQEQKVIDLLFAKLMRGDRRGFEHSLRSHRRCSTPTWRDQGGAGAMNVIVCGGSNFENYAAVKKYLDMLHDLHRFTLLIHGRAKGADTCAHRWAGERHVPVEMFPAHWRLHGKSAGPIRNKQMLVEGKPQLVVAFPGGDGTADMCRQARAAGVTVILKDERTRAEVTQRWRTITALSTVSATGPTCPNRSAT